MKRNVRLYHDRFNAWRYKIRYSFVNSELRRMGIPETVEIAGKTGTTQNNSDGWFMGITPNLATGFG